MKKYTIDIPEPCHEKWEQMSPTGRGRHCATCDKVVVDFTEMKDADLLQYLLQHKNVCGRVRKDQLQRPVFLSQPPRKYYWPALAAMLVAGMFYMPTNLSAQDNVMSQHEQDQGEINSKSHDPYQSSLFNDTIFYIKGVVKDDNGEVVPFASIDIEWNGKILTGQYADIDGYFNILLSANYQQETLIIKVSSVGLNNLTMTYPPGSLGKEHLVIELKSGVTIKGLIILSTPPMIKKNKTIDDHTFDRNDLMTFPR